MPPIDHLTTRELASLVAGELDGEAREAAEAHLSVCRACRGLWVAGHDTAAVEADVPPVPAPVLERARGLVPPLGPPKRTTSRPRTWLPLLAAAVASIALGWVLLTGDRRGPEAPARVARSAAGPASAPTLIAPSNGAEIDGETPRFRWSAVADATTYDLTVLDERGDIVHRARTAEVAVAIAWPATRGLPRPGETYYWFVCAQRIDGAEPCSSVARFVIDRRP